MYMNIVMIIIQLCVVSLWYVCIHQNYHKLFNLYIIHYIQWQLLELVMLLKGVCVHNISQCV